MTPLPPLLELQKDGDYKVYRTLSLDKDGYMYDWFWLSDPSFPEDIEVIEELKELLR